jgi:leucyl-tRNA synthetase
MLAPIMPYLCEEENSLFSKHSVFKEEWPKFSEKELRGSDFVINGILLSGNIAGTDYENMGAFLNSIISEVRKAKAKEKKALNYEISSININVPEEYYSVTLSSKEELMQICKAKKVVINKGEYSIKVDI